jgi:tRNA (cytidine/uridine-2'-O-)-methyltransferase
MKRMNHPGNRDISASLGFRVALYQPDIAGNTGTILRTAACLGFSVDLIEPAGFDVSDRNLKRAGMDYLDMAALTRHVDWAAFLEASTSRRIILATTRGAVGHSDFMFQPGDTILFGRESAGLPDSIHLLGHPAVKIDMQDGARSLNLAISVAIFAAEAIRQTKVLK